jgi:hypothetical protein
VATSGVHDVLYKKGKLTEAKKDIEYFTFDFVKALNFSALTIASRIVL